MTVVDRISAQARRHLGIVLPSHKEAFWDSRLSKLLAREGFDSREALAESLDQGDERAVDALARHLTTNHTYFFREERHLQVLPSLLRDGGVEKPRIWSAAGSTGEEGYSIAMTLAEAGFRDYLVLVSDVNRAVLAEGARGVYRRDEIERVPALWRARHLEAEKPGWVRVRASLRDHLRFRHINLMQPWEAAEKFDAIFCRNLLIYLDQEGIRQLLGRLVDTLKPGGLLFLGESEGFHKPAGLRAVSGASVSRREGA